MARAFITGVEALALNAGERSFLREADPWGAILFRRNVDTPEQVRRLVDEIRACLGRADAPVLIDQEGGRVQRLGPPHWMAYPPGAAYAALYDIDRAQGLEAARLGARLIAADLIDLGITVDCLPLADVPVAGANDVIGDRAYGTAPDKVAAIGAAVAQGLMEGGVLPVLKHLPGHGRANADSHEQLPVVATDRATLEATDFAAFTPLRHLPLGMTAHVVYAAIDPIEPATTSAKVVRDIIRDVIGFEGALMSDDLSMGALAGSMGARSRAALTAGCDLLLHCNGHFDEMQVVAAAAPQLAGEAARRAAAALAAQRPPAPLDRTEAHRRFSAIMAPVVRVAERTVGA
ncbi:MAG: beta-N-acetylhexosaminidase [Variibacter sp.]|nr:beta-N-acetylhexosaminidase [Variibacter sp.]